MIWDRCHICNEQIVVGDECFEIGYKPSDMALICKKCNRSIIPYDTVAAYKKYVGEDEDG
jgi:hypothetical protein